MYKSTDLTAQSNSKQIHFKCYLAKPATQLSQGTFSNDYNLSIAPITLENKLKLLWDKWNW